MIRAKKKIDFTSGKIFPKLFWFSLPIIATNLLQVCYNAADMMIVSLSDEPNAVGAIGTTTSLIALIINAFIGFSVGANVAIAKRLGAKDNESAARATHTSVLLSVILGIGCMVITLVVARPILVWMGNTGNVLELAHTYTVVYALGIPFTSLTNFLVSVYRAKGDSKTPLRVLSLSGLVNVLLNLFFVLALGMSVDGVALATAIANLLSASVFVFKLMRANDATRLVISRLRIDKKSLRDIIVIGLPTGIQFILFSISTILIQSSIVALDAITTPDPNISPVINGNAAQANLDNFVYQSTCAVYQAATTFTSQNFGANKIDRIKKGALQSYVLVLSVSLFVSGLMIAFHPFLLSLYNITPGESGSASMIAYESARLRLYLVTIFYALLGLSDVSTGIMRGIGKSVPPMILTIFSICILRVFWTLVVFPNYMTLTNLLLSFPISWGFAALVGIILSVIYVNALKGRVTEDPLPEVQAVN